MRKIIKRYGNTTVLTFNTEECKIYGIEEGMLVDIVLTRIDGESEA